MLKHIMQIMQLQEERCQKKVNKIKTFPIWSEREKYKISYPETDLEVQPKTDHKYRQNSDLIILGRKDKNINAQHINVRI